MTDRKILQGNRSGNGKAHQPEVNTHLIHRTRADLDSRQDDIQLSIQLLTEVSCKVSLSLELLAESKDLLASTNVNWTKLEEFQQTLSQSVTTLENVLTNLNRT